MNLTQKTFIGIFWNISEQLLSRGVGVIVTLLLARFLSPADYGLIAMMSLFMSIASLVMQSGFLTALIRLKETTQDDLNTAFYANLSLGALSYALLFVCAPFIADFYDEIRLVSLVRVTGVVVVINSFQIVQSAILNRKLDFQNQFRASLVAGISSGVVAVGLAFAGLGVWALVSQMLLGAFLTTVLLWHFQRWRPSLSFSKKSFLDMYSFGYKFFLSGLLNIVFNNMYVVLIAKYFASTITGYYFFAHKIKELIVNQCVNSIQSVSYPALSTMQEDNVRLKSSYRKIIKVTTFLLYPSIIFSALFSEYFFTFFLNIKWLPAVPYFQLMCVTAILYPLHAINMNILKVKGRSDLILYIEILKKISAVMILFISFNFGIIGILIGQIFASVIAYVPNSYYSSKMISYSVAEQLSDALPGLSLASTVALIVYGSGFFMTFPVYLKFGMQVVMAMILYFMGAHIFKIQAYVMVKEVFSKSVKRFY